MSRIKSNHRYAILNRNRVRRYRYFKGNNNTQNSSEEEDIDCQLDMSINGVQEGKTLRELLRSWVNCFRISMRAVNALLKILNMAG